MHYFLKVNPNIGSNANSGFFRVGILDLGTNYLYYNSKAGVVETGDSPGWAYLSAIKPENLFARWVSTKYLFNFTIWDKLPVANERGSV